MLFGESTTPPEAHRLLSEAAEAGINFFDTAEMYPVPQRAETQVGAWARCAVRAGRRLPGDNVDSKWMHAQLAAGFE